jgi:uncharacterized membrane protein (UPF0127 family)
MKLQDPDRQELSVEVDRPRGVLGRMKGLMGAPPPEAGRGLLLRTRQVHTWGVGYPIDAVYIAKTGVILRVTTLPPRRIGPLVTRARWVLEMAAGEAARLGLEADRTLILVEP